MEVSVLNINGQETGRKVQLNDAIFGIEPNDHVLYLDVKQYLATGDAPDLAPYRETEPLFAAYRTEVLNAIERSKNHE